MTTCNGGRSTVETEPLLDVSGLGVKWLGKVCKLRLPLDPGDVPWTSHRPCSPERCDECLTLLLKTWGSADSPASVDDTWGELAEAKIRAFVVRILATRAPPTAEQRATHAAPVTTERKAAW